MNIYSFNFRRRESLLISNRKKPGNKIRKSKMKKVLSEILSSAGTNLSQAAESILFKKGGQFVPDFGHSDTIQYEETQSWNKISKYLSGSDTNEHLRNYIKNRKGEEAILNHILSSSPENRVVNSNILKCMIMEKFILPDVKNTQKKKNTRTSKRDTQKAFSNIINRESRINSIIRQVKLRSNRKIKSIKPKLRSKKKKKDLSLNKTIMNPHSPFIPSERSWFSNPNSPTFSIKNIGYQNEYSPALDMNNGSRFSSNLGASSVFSQAVAQNPISKFSSNFSATSHNFSTADSFQQMRNQLNQMSVTLKNHRKGTTLFNIQPFVRAGAMISHFRSAIGGTLKAVGSPSLNL